jgi:hypothetical protein
MMSSKTKRYTKEVLYHPYVGLQLAPLVVDFTDHFENINRRWFEEGIITKQDFVNNNELAKRLRQTEDPSVLEEIINIIKYHLEWGD